MARSTDASPQETDGKQTYPFRGGVEDFSRTILDFGNRCYFHHCLSRGNNPALLGHTNSCEDVISCKISARLLSAVLGHHYIKRLTLCQLLTVTTFVYCRCGSTVQG